MIFNRGLKKRIAELEKQVLDSDRKLKLTDIEELSELFGVNRSVAGPAVNPDTAMKCSAVYACVRLIAGAIASLPLVVYRRANGDDIQDPAHPLSAILRIRPNNLMAAMTFWELMVGNILLQGNGYAVIGRNRGGGILDLTPVKPQRVSVHKSWELKFNDAEDRLYYVITLENGQSLMFDQDDILHIPNVGWDGKKGLSTISAALQPVGVALAAEEHSGRFFSNGADPHIGIQYEKKLSPEAIDKLREYWERRQAGLVNAHLPLIVTEGGTITPLSMNAADAQLIESRNFQVIDIARFFGVPPHMIGEMTKQSSWGTGIEQMSTAFVMYTLRPHFKRIEQELERKLFRSGSHYAQFKHQALLRGDTKTRHESYKIARGSMQEPGYMTINEIRRLENLPPIDGGDELQRAIAKNGGTDGPENAV